MALISCQECGKEVSELARACPGCGAPVLRRRPVKGSYVPHSNHEVAVLISRKKKTSHVLHLLLSILTVGIWLFIWLLVSLSNANENTKIDAKIRKGKLIK